MRRRLMLYSRGNDGRRRCRLSTGCRPSFFLSVIVGGTAARKRSIYRRAFLAFFPTDGGEASIVGNAFFAFSTLRIKTFILARFRLLSCSSISAGNPRRKKNTLLYSPFFALSWDRNRGGGGGSEELELGEEKRRPRKWGLVNNGQDRRSGDREEESDKKKDLPACPPFFSPVCLLWPFKNADTTGAQRKPRKRILLCKRWGKCRSVL